MNRLSKTLMVLHVAAGLSGLAIQARAADPVKPDVNRGQAIAVQVCASCHGADGNSAGGAIFRQTFLRGAQRVHAFLARQFVAFGKQRVDRLAGRREPLDHAAVQIRQRAARVHHQDHAAQLRA